MATDIRKHIDDVARKYICPGETAEGALIFLPSEALHADLHALFGTLVAEAGAARRLSRLPRHALGGARRHARADARRAAAGRGPALRREVAKLAEETERLDRRVASLKRHFADMQVDVQQIEITAQKITAAGARIEAVEMDPPAAAARAAE